MKKAIAKEKSSRLINCGMVIMVSSNYKDKNNIVTCAWRMPGSKNPPLLGVALAKSHFSSELIKKNGEFIINIPSWGLLDKVVLCGSFSGRDKDKFKETGLISQKANHLVKTPKIKECIGSIECVLSDIKEIGDHYVFWGEAVCAEAEEEYFVNDMWDTTGVDLIFHLGGRFFFKSSPHTEIKR